MNSIIIYFSYHRGNTSKIAHVIGRELHSDIARSKDFNVKNLKQYDLIGLGSGIYNGKPHKSILELVDKLDESCKDKYFFIFCTSRKNQDCYLDELEFKLKSKGVKYLGKFQTYGEYDRGIFKFFGGLNRGRPNIDDFHNAVEFAKKIKEMLQNEKLENN
ncbi:MAG: flavodoxin domain-containing protein [candidate division WOR-3 bacterium]